MGLDVCGGVGLVCPGDSLGNYGISLGIRLLLAVIWERSLALVWSSVVLS